mmetsp:Transcript_48503/g.89991  ORF Transcript_48503/g.89991 Transcript_48503/m.89991 type:complete len:104 (-) Transcript_48503:631-942(-)
MKCLFRTEVPEMRGHDFGRRPRTLTKASHAAKDRPMFEIVLISLPAHCKESKKNRSLASSYCDSVLGKELFILSGNRSKALIWVFIKHEIDRIVYVWERGTEE